MSIRAISTDMEHAMNKMTWIAGVSFFGLLALTGGGCAGEGSEETTSENEGTGSAEDVSESEADGETEDAQTGPVLPDGFAFSDEAFWKTVDFGEETLWHSINPLPSDSGWHYVATGDLGAVALYNGIEVENRNIGVVNSVRDAWGDGEGGLVVVGDDLVRLWDVETEEWSEGQLPGLPPEENIGQMNAVYGTGSSNIYIGGENGQLYQWKGTSWVTVHDLAGINSNETVDDIWVSQGEIAFVVTGTKIYWGQSIAWQSADLPKAMNSVFGFASNNVYAAGGIDVNNVGGLGDAISHFTIQGWESQATPAPAKKGLNGIWGPDPNAVYAIGNGGTILELLGGPETTTWELIDNASTLNPLSLKKIEQTEDETPVSAANLTLRGITGQGPDDVILSASRPGLDELGQPDGEEGLILHYAKHPIEVE